MFPAVIPFAGYLTSIGTWLASYLGCLACQCATREVLQHSARVAWSVLFFVATVAAWVLRDFATPLMEKIPWIVRHVAQMDVDPDKWFGEQAVYRFSMGNFLFFSTMAGIMVGVRFRSDKRDVYLHHGHWALKLGMWLVFTLLPFFFPVQLVTAYSWLARFVSPVFLVIQMVILLDFVQSWNDAWVSAAEEGGREEGGGGESYLYALLALTVGAYAGAATLAGLMYHWFKPSGAGACSLNVALVTLALLLCLGITTVSLALAGRGGGGRPGGRGASVFPAAVVALYTMYLCFSALQSEPHDYQCNGLAQKLTAASGSTLAVGMVVTLISVVYAAFRAGSNTSLFSLDGSDDDAKHNAPEREALLAEEGTSAGLDGVPEGQIIERGAKKESALDDFQPVSYNYAFFHLIFALASMYIAMLMTGWGSQVQEKDRIDIGWTSVWVKVAAQWVTALLYIWTLVAPELFPDRDFS